MVRGVGGSILQASKRGRAGSGVDMNKATVAGGKEGVSRAVLSCG